MIIGASCSYSLIFTGSQDQHLVDEDTLEEDGSQDAELQGLMEDAVYTTMRFSRPFRSCDPHDQDITVKQGGRGEKHSTVSSFFFQGCGVNPNLEHACVLGNGHSSQGFCPSPHFQALPQLCPSTNPQALCQVIPPWIKHPPQPPWLPSPRTFLDFTEL